MLGESSLSQHDEHSSVALTRRNMVLNEPPPVVDSPSLLQNINFKFLMDSLLKKIKYLVPPRRKPSNVMQEWEKSPDDTIGKATSFFKENLTQEICSRHWSTRTLWTLEAFLSVFYIWFMTISIVFRISVGTELMLLTLFVRLVKGALLLYFYTYQQPMEIDCRIDWFEDIFEPVTLISGALTMVLSGYTGSNSFWNALAGIHGFATLLIECKNAANCWEPIKGFAESRKLHKEFRLIQLFLLILTISHFFGLGLFALTYIPDVKVWTEKAEIADKEWWIQYVYSLYWTVTTLVTVGYGDLVPTNVYEVIAIVIVQLLGTSMFGYTINVIGLTVQEIQKKSKKFKTYQATISKLREHYQLSKGLCSKIKNDIIQRESLDKEIPLRPEDQNHLLSSIESSLKDEFVLETNMKVIKKSIFFLTHFTVNFQNEVALRLIRCIYKPGEVIRINSNGDRNLVLLNSGQVDIYALKNYNNVSYRQLVKTIKTIEGKPNLNVFGYSSLILNRDISLEAVAKEIAVTYMLKRQDVLECVAKSMLDFESLIELKERLIQMRQIEQIQAPTLNNRQQHYVPNIFILQKKIVYQHQQRRPFTRSQRRSKRKIVTLREYQYKAFVTIRHTHRQEDSDEEPQTHLAHQASIMPPSSDSLMLFDQARNYQNFWKNFNLNKVAKKYQNSCSKLTYRKRIISTFFKKPRPSPDEDEQ